MVTAVGQVRVFLQLSLFHPEWQQLMMIIRQIGGSVYRDVVKFSNLAIPEQAVEVATQLSSTFLGEHSSDGLLGLAFPT
jgi:Eukaryotic aspartyl protease